MKENSDFIAAYCKIKDIYEKTNTSSGVLEKIGFCNKWNSVFATGGQAGIAFNFTGEHAVYGPVSDFKPFISLQRYIGKSLFEFTEYLLSLSGIQMRSICLAALNALSQPINSPEQLKNRGICLRDSDDFNFVRHDDIVTVVGYGGIERKFQGRCKEIHVLDMRHKSNLQTLTVGETIEYGPSGVFFHSAEENREILPKSDIVIMSGCTLVNGTFKELIEYSQKARIIGMFGPSGQIIPDFLLNCGINYILSCRIIQPNGLYSRIMDVFYPGNVFREYTKPYAVTAVSFPH
jgi:uncharacterized protein (DUF4213/DUF364 family)